MDTPTCDVIRDRFSKRLVTANHTTPGGMSLDLAASPALNIPKLSLDSLDRIQLGATQLHIIRLGGVLAKNSRLCKFVSE